MARSFIAIDEQVYHQPCLRKRYFSKDEIEYHSPSRKDGIKYTDESHLRELYCSFLQELGMTLKLPQVTIATSMIFCHRFYMSQSHAKNDWQTVATACMFVSSKAEDTPRCLNDLLVVAYKLLYTWDPVAPQRIKQKEIFDKQKDIILQAEIVLLATLAFDFNVEQPYKPLVAAVKKLGLSQNDIMKVAWNFVNDWLRTTLCLQYKPCYIAAGSLFLASKLQKVKLPSTKGNTWWIHFVDVSPKQLEEVIQQMVKILEQNKKPVKQQTSAGDKVAEPKQVNSQLVLSSPESCVSDGSVVTPTEVRNVSLPVEVEDSSRPHIDNSETEGCGIMIDVYGIKERLKKRKVDRKIEKRSVITGTFVDDDVVVESESWIEREIEDGIQKPCCGVSPKNEQEWTLKK